MSLHSYQQVQKATGSPRQTEYRLFAQVTKALMDSQSNPAVGSLAKAIHWNRRLWFVLQADCADDANQLPEALRAGIISLGIWVDKYSRQVLKGEADIAPLIEVNRSIMEGLASR